MKTLAVNVKSIYEDWNNFCHEQTVFTPSRMNKTLRDRDVIAINDILGANIAGWIRDQEDEWEQNWKEALSILRNSDIARSPLVKTVNLRWLFTDNGKGKGVDRVLAGVFWSKQPLKTEQVENSFASFEKKYVL